MESINQGCIPQKESSAVNPYNGMFGQQGCIYPKFDEILEANRDVLERIQEKGD